MCYKTRSEPCESVKVYPTIKYCQESISSLPMMLKSMLVFYLKILIGHPWNQGWSGFSSAKATSEVAQEVGQGERESDNLKERINISSKYWMEMKYSPPTQAIWALGRRLQWKRRESKMQGQQRDPPKILTPCNMFSPGFEGWKKTPRLLKACAGPPLLCSQRPRWTHPRRWCSSTTWFAICSQVLSRILAEDLSPARMRPLTFLTVQKSSERRRMMRTKLPMKLSENQPQRR